MAAGSSNPGCAGPGESNRGHPAAYSVPDSGEENFAWHWIFGATRCRQ